MSDLQRDVRLYIRGTVRDYLNEFRVESALALARLERDTPNDQGRKAAWIALAGNLIWVASAFVAPEAQAIIALTGAELTSFAGFYATKQSTGQNGVAIIRKQIEDFLLKHIDDPKIIDRIANTIYRGYPRARVNDIGYLDRFIWQTMFKIPFEDVRRSKMQQAIYDAAWKLLNIAESEYNAYIYEKTNWMAIAMGRRSNEQMYLEGCAMYGMGAMSCAYAQQKLRSLGATQRAEQDTLLRGMELDPFGAWLSRRPKFIEFAASLGINSLSKDHGRKMVR